MTHRFWKPAAIAVALLALVAAGVTLGGHDSATAAMASTDAPVVHVFKDPNCSCCSKWVDYMRKNGFAVVTTDVPSQSQLDGIKQLHGVPTAGASCHTALVGKYVIEGHVPADLVQKLLRERPDVIGLSVPGMQSGSPGMEGPTPAHYDVVAIHMDGTTSVYAHR